MSLRTSATKHFTVAATFAAYSLLFLLISPIALAAQERFFEVSSVIRDVKQRFNLSKSDIRYISPRIRQESDDVNLIYARFGGHEPEYSPAVWTDVIDRRLEFEKRLRLGLTDRQKTALRSARSALERRILTSLVQEYVDFVGEVLDLEELQFEGIDYLLNSEFKRKHAAVLRYIARPQVLEAELTRIDQQTDHWLNKILTPAEMRLYRALSTGAGQPIG